MQLFKNVNQEVLLTKVLIKIQDRLVKLRNQHSETAGVLLDDALERRESSERAVRFFRDAIKQEQESANEDVIALQNKAANVGAAAARCDAKAHAIQTALKAITFFDKAV